jgi:hypothetical protein
MFNISSRLRHSITWYRLVPLFIILITLLAISNINLSKGYQDGSIESDGKGYYAYLPAVFIYHDLSFRFYYQIENKDYYNPNGYYPYLRMSHGKVVNKYYSGTALCMLPFFALGHLTTLMSDLPADGYSYYYILWIHLGAVIYLFFALLLLRKLLRTYHIQESWIALTLSVIVFGTNLFFYVLTEYSMSHNYSFFFITAFLLVTRQFFLVKDQRFIMLAGFLLGIIVLIRPINILVLLSIPFVAGDFQNLVDGIKKLFSKIHYLLIGLILFLGIISIQLIIYKIQTGSIFVYSYPGEGFNFTSPHILDMLFSYRKGLFLYTPVILLSFTGLYYIIRENRFRGISFFIFFLLVTYIFSSWHMWFYGGSFSQRVFIDYYALFAILLAFAFQRLPSGMFKKSFLTLVFILTLFCQYQTYQYRHMVIHWSDMTKEKYWDGFFKLNP